MIHLEIRGVNIDHAIYIFINFQFLSFICFRTPLCDFYNPLNSPNASQNLSCM